MASLASKITLVASCAATAGIVFFVSCQTHGTKKAKLDKAENISPGKCPYIKC